MAAKQIRTPATSITSSYTTPDADVVDMGAFRVVGIQCRRLKTQAGANTVTVQHSCWKDQGSWVSSTIVFNLDGTGSDWQELTSFGRYLRLLGSAGADGTAIVQVDWIGKE